MTAIPWIILRILPSGGQAEELAACLKRQGQPFRLFILDDGQAGDAFETVRQSAQKIVSCGNRVPGSLLNEAMMQTDGAFVVFLSSECIPRDETWLGRLLAGFSSDRVTAVFSRQQARPEHCLFHMRDMEESYGEGHRPRWRRHFFSLAAAALRRELWAKMPFDEKLECGAGLEWTWRARQKGYTVRYVPESAVLHALDYTPGELYREYYDLGKAEAMSLPWSRWERSLLCYTLAPFAQRVMDDWKYCIPRFALKTMFYAPLIRFNQFVGRRRGFLDGLKSRLHRQGSEK